MENEEIILEIDTNKEEMQEVQKTSEGTDTSNTDSATIQEDSESFTIEKFNTIETVQGTVKLNETILMELKTTNLYLNMILIAIVLCFLYVTINKALKKLFYINI